MCIRYEVYRTVWVHMYLIEHDAFRLEPVARPDILQRVQDLLPVGVLLVPELVGRKRQDDLLLGEITCKCKKHVQLHSLTSLSPNFSQSSFICVKSRTVVPHKEATFSMSTTFPSSSRNLNYMMKMHCS